MTFHSLTRKTLMTALAVTAFAAPAASALEPFTYVERQALASRGVGAPVPSAVPAPPTKVDLRSPDATDVFSPSGHNVPVAPAVTPQPSSSDGFDWGLYALIAAALAACVALVTMARRRQQHAERALGI